MDKRRRFGRETILAVLLALVGILAGTPFGYAAGESPAGCSGCHKVKPGSAVKGRPGSIVVKIGGVSPHRAPLRANPGAAPAAPQGAPRTR